MIYCVRVSKWLFCALAGVFTYLAFPTACRKLWDKTTEDFMQRKEVKQISKLKIGHGNGSISQPWNMKVNCQRLTAKGLNAQSANLMVFNSKIWQWTSTAQLLFCCCLLALCLHHLALHPSSLLLCCWSSCIGSPAEYVWSVAMGKAADEGAELSRSTILDQERVVV